MNYPETYLHVVECRSGDTFVVPIASDDPLDLRVNVEKWIASQFDGELVLSPPLMPKLDGDYYARVMTDGRPPDSVVCWEGAGFYLQPATATTSDGGAS